MECVKYASLSLIALQCIVTTLVADTISVRNFADKPVYAAIYYVQGRSNDGAPGLAERATDVITIPALGTQQLERPDRKTYGSGLSTRWYDRDLYIAENQDTLQPSVNKGSLPFVNVGSTQGQDFIINSLGEQLAAFSLKQSSYITVHNKTDTELFAAIYYLEGRSTDQTLGTAYRFNGVIRIPAQTSQQILRPPQRCKFYVNNVCSNFEDRDLYIAYTADDLQPMVPKGSLTSINIGSTQGTNFYIEEEDDALVSHTYASWVTQPATRYISAMKNRLFAALRKQFEEHEHQHISAMVRTGDTLAAEEQAYLSKRLPRVKQNLEKLLALQLQDAEIPVIAFCSSGGGCRAMISTLGSFLGAEQIGLLNACTYNAGLSGSTWAITTWLESGMGIQEYSNTLPPKFAKNITAPISVTAGKQLSTSLLARLAFHQQLSMIDVYGGLLAEKFLRKSDVANPQQIKLADQAQYLSDGAKIFPIYTALIAQQPYEWIEYTPYEIGSGRLKAFVPSWAFGREFKAGSSQDFAPAIPLGFCMGTWGSAISVNVQEAFNTVSQGMPTTAELFGIKIPASVIMTELAASLKKVPQIGRQRVYPAQIANWMFGLTGPYQHITQVTLVDAGLDFNLPVPPLLRTTRNVSVIIIFDASSNSETADELRKAESYARRHGLKFPKIDYTKVHDICSVHSDADPSVPTVIYLPLVANSAYNNGWDPHKQAFTGTFNFVYTPQEVQILSGLTQANIVASKDMIIAAIKDVIEKRRAPAAAA